MSQLTLGKYQLVWSEMSIKGINRSIHQILTAGAFNIHGSEGLLYLFLSTNN